MNNIFVSWKQKIESRIISDLKSQYTESEEQIRQRKEQFLKKQKKIILIEIIAGAVFLAFSETFRLLPAASTFCAGASTIKSMIRDITNA